MTRPTPALLRGGTAAAVGLSATLALMALAVLVPLLTGWNVRVRWFPPLHAAWDPRVGLGTVPALVVGLLAVRWGVGVARRLPWRVLLLASYGAALAWLFALAFVDGADGIGAVLDHPYEYLRTARATTDVPGMLEEYVSRIPYSAEPDNWPVHVAGHPPAALLTFIALARIGLGGGFAAGTVVTLVVASTAAAVLVTMRELGAERHARLAAPFLVFGPAAIWSAVSADAMFGTVAAWGMAALARASVRRSLGWSLVAGLLLGWCVMLSYGLPLLGVLAVAVLWLGGSWRPLVPAALAALAVVLAFLPFGFAWWEGLWALRGRYWEGVAGRRPPEYWMWGNLAALAFSAGPLVGAGLAHLGRHWREVAAGPGGRIVLWLSGAGAGMVLLAHLSQMSRGEVERIWLPFVPWLLLSCALLPERWRRWGLGLQAGFALVVQHLLWTGW